MDSAGIKKAQPVREDDKDPGDTRGGNTETTSGDGEKSIGGPPPDATKRERRTGTPRNSGSVEYSSTSEGSLSSEEVTPPIVVIVVPGTGRSHNGVREANLQREKTDAKKSQTTGESRLAARPQAEDDNGGELIDGEMIYVDNDGATVGIKITCSDTESAHADHSNQ